MSAINPISGVRPPMSSPQVGGAGAAARGDESKGDFGKTLQTYIDRVDSDQQASASAIQDLLSGKSEDVLPVVAAVAKADMSFKLLLGVRNKVVEAYKQTMNMQV